MDELYDHALDYLRVEFEPQKEFDLHLVGTFTRHPFSGPGRYVIYTFASGVGSDKPEDFFVVTGAGTDTNYYPDWGLSPAELWAVHLGTEFFLRVGITGTKIHDPSSFLAQADVLIRTTFNRRPDEPPLLEEGYFLNGIEQQPSETHVVGKCRVEGRIYKFIVGDIPHTVILKDVSADVAWRLHMGNLLLQE